MSAKKAAGNKQLQRGRREARVAAVQALYQLDLNSMRPREAIAEFITHRLPDDADRGLFGEIVTGATDRQADIDRMLDEALSEGWTVPRLEAVLRAILRAGTWELLGHADVPARAVINEYMDIAHAFFAGREPGLVNGVLDKLAHVLRDAEFHR